MAKNQRQRRPLQDEGRTEKATARERAQASRRQRDRIEENRDRREQRRERNRLRRQTVDSIRSPKEDIRVDRLDSRLMPVEDTFLGRPVGVPTDLPVLIGERWGANESNEGFSDGVEANVTWWVPTYTTERNGYPALLVGGSGGDTFRIPAGLAGVWDIRYHVTWAATSSTGIRTHTVVLVEGDVIVAYMSFDGENTSGEVNTRYLFNEGDEFYTTANQNSGGSLDLLGASVPQFTYLELTFVGK